MYTGCSQVTQLATTHFRTVFGINHLMIIHRSSEVEMFSSALLIALLLILSDLTSCY